MAPGRIAGQSSRVKKRHADASRKSGDRKGNARNFITRTQAVKKLQLSLPDFRKLCIWKGIYPREPRSKKKVVGNSNASTTFYYFKDIQYLLHEPLVAKFRDQKVLEKKISKALGRGDVSNAARWEKHAARPELTGKPRYTLDHVIRERYPTFVDALRDLDDCLSMLFLFANLPSTSTVPAKMIARCERLCHEFQHYLIVSHSLRKSFLSIKGIYYQANIMGEDILWLVPYKFNQRVVGDVDFRIMGTFIEFYMTLLGFINFRLYTTVGLKYPPRFDQKKDEEGGELGAFTLEGTNPVAKDDEAEVLTNEPTEHGPDPETQAEVNKLVKQLRSEEQANGNDTSADKSTDDADEEQATETFDKFEPVAPGGDVLAQPSYSTNDPSRLFSKCTFYLSRETPRQPLEFLLRAFGCKRIGWDSVLGEGAYTTDPLDPSITHHVVDRPVLPASNEETEDNQTSQKIQPNQRIPGRIYVQPQWVWDCVNDEELKQANLYAPGAQLPPHLSPFVKSVQGQYDPTVPLEEQQTEAEALQDSDAEEEIDDDEDAEMDEDEEDELADRLLAAGAVDMDVAGPESDSDASAADADETFGGFSDEEAAASSDDDEASAAIQRQRELEAELTGKPVRSKEAPVDAKAKAKAEARKALARETKQQEEDLERAKGMLPKKKRKLYEQMVYTNKKKDTESEKLRAKRRRLEREAGKKA